MIQMNISSKVSQAKFLFVQGGVTNQIWVR